MDFSSNSKQLALGFADGSVGLVALLTFKGGQTRWDVVGQQTAHPAPASLVGLTFGEAPSGVTKLFSLGNNDNHNADENDYAHNTVRTDDINHDTENESCSVSHRAEHNDDVFDVMPILPSWNCMWLMCPVFLWHYIGLCVCSQGWYSGRV